MTHPTSELTGEQDADRASVARVGLFSHTPEAEVFEQRRPLVSDDAGWRTKPFSGAAAAEQRRSAALNDED
jgi:hypothetical protein